MGTKVRIFIFIASLSVMLLGACHKSENRPKAPVSFEELSAQGHALCRKGDYVAGMSLLQAAKDSLAAMHPDSINYSKAVMLLGNIANLYVRMGLFEEAKQVNSEAIAIAEASAPGRLPELWSMRGIIYKHSNKPDSVVICRRSGIRLCDRIDDMEFRQKVKKRITENLYWYYIENPGFAPDSVQAARAALERILAEDPTDHTAFTNRLLIGRAYVLSGDYSRGLPLMESSLDKFRERGDTESVEWGLQLLAKSYATARDPKLFDIYTETAEMHDTIMQRQHEDLLLGMDFRYRTSQLLRDKEILEGQLREKRQRIVFITAIAILVVASLIVNIVMRNRNNRRQLRLKQQNIDTLLAERIALNTRIEELNRSMSGCDAETKRLEVHQTILLEKDDEQRFRKTFNDLHPGFIDRLRREFPELTPGNELLCMLIALNRRNEEIALALGISRESVATSRYRLRTRFNLPKDVELNDFIQSKL